MATDEASNLESSAMNLDFIPTFDGEEKPLFSFMGFTDIMFWDFFYGLAGGLYSQDVKGEVR